MSLLPQRLLQIGLAFVFLYAAVGGFLHPENWVGFSPNWLPLDKFLALKLFSVFEIILAVWLLSGWKLKYSSPISALALLGILVSAGLDEITFRDVGLLLAGLALYWMVKQK